MLLKMKKNGFYELEVSTWREASKELPLLLSSIICHLQNFYEYLDDSREATYQIPNSISFKKSYRR